MDVPHIPHLDRQMDYQFNRCFTIGRGRSELLDLNGLTHNLGAKKYAATGCMAENIEVISPGRFEEKRGNPLGKKTPILPPDTRHAFARS